MKIGIISYCIGSAAASIALAQVQPNTLSLRGYNDSLALNTGASGINSIHFSTFDGTATQPPLSENIGGSPLFSREWNPRLAAASGQYLADYLVFAGNTVVEYGWNQASLQMGDSDFNGVPDILQRDQPGDASFIGQGAVQFPAAANLSVTGVFNRPANQDNGTYIITLTSNRGGTSYTGDFNLVHWEGSAAYVRGAVNSITWSLAYRRPDGQTIAYAGQTGFTVLGVNQVQIPPFTLTDSLNQTIQVGPMELQRQGREYFGRWQVSDGYTVTSWADYTFNTVVFEDDNDGDGDGIPDLSDNFMPRPIIQQQPRSQAIVAGATATFSVQALSDSVLSYQWRFNGADLPLATQASLVLPNFQARNIGDYAVLVRNAGGSVLSETAALTLVQAPVIAQQPQSLSVVRGEAAVFTVQATGTEPLNYQWRFANNPIADAIGATLELNDVRIEQAGNYSVIVSNAAASVVSQIAQLTVLVPPAITQQPPAMLTVSPGDDLSFSVTATGTAPLGYQWRLNGEDLPSRRSSTLNLFDVQPAQSGLYTVMITNIAGSVVSSSTDLRVGFPPQITHHPESQSVVTVGSDVSLRVEAEGTGPLEYQWRRAGVPITGQIASQLVLSQVSGADSGRYSVVVSNPVGSVISADAAVTVITPLLAGFFAGTGQFRLVLTGAPGASYVIECTADLLTWEVLVSFSNISGSVSFDAPASPAVIQRRYYRARPLP